jgi:threonine/homoserine/homoserine lactone efflux protein
MNVAHALIAFALAAGLLTITPGLDTALVLRTAAVEGRRRGLLAGLGISCGVLVWGLAGAVGISALLAVSHYAYTALRIGGACYLTYLGITLLLRRPSHPPVPKANMLHAIVEPTAAVSGSRWFARGFLTNILNPKVGVFYISFHCCPVKYFADSRKPFRMKAIAGKTP